MSLVAHASARDIPREDLKPRLDLAFSTLAGYLYLISGDASSFVAQASRSNFDEIDARYQLHVNLNIASSGLSIFEETSRMKEILKRTVCPARLKIKLAEYLTFYEDVLFSMATQECKTNPSKIEHYTQSAQNVVNMAESLKSFTEVLSRNIDQLEQADSAYKSVRQMAKNLGYVDT